MKEKKILPQVEFSTLQEFIEGKVNYHNYFVKEKGLASEIYRTRPHFLRFQKQYSAMEKNLTATITNIPRLHRNENYLPNEDLWESYKLMSAFVYLDDPDILYAGKPDERLLTR